MTNITAFRPVAHEKMNFKGFCYIKCCPLRAWPFVTPGTSFEQISISLPQGCSMPNIKVFQASGS